MIDIEPEVKKQFDEAEDYIQIVDKLTLNYTQPLDTLIREIRNLLQKHDYEISSDELECFYLKISTELYFLLEHLKEFEIYSSLSKANGAEAYNEAYLCEAVNADKKPSVAELQIRAELKSKKESLVNTVYTSAFKNIKTKIETGNLIADTLKNIIKSRTSMEFLNQSNKGVN